MKWLGRIALVFLAASGSGARWAWKSASEGNGEMEFTAAVAITRLNRPSERRW